MKHLKVFLMVFITGISGMAQNCPPPEAEFSFSDSCLVVGNAIQFLADSIPGTGYYWEFSDGTTSTDVNPVHVFENYGYYCVKLTVNNACGSDTFHLPKPVYVNLSSCACDASDGGWYDYDYRDGYTINSYNVETWSVTGSNHRIFVEGDIIIEPYAQLIIDDSVIVEFAPNGRIIVQAGGKLTIGSNVLLTGIYFAPWTSSKDAPWCAGNMWQGIEVWGNNDDPHVENEQGIVEILNEENVTIENAHIGILSGARNMKYLCDNTEPLFDSEKGCGLVRINSKTHFINDGIGIKLLSREPLYNIGGYWSGNVIQNCDFRTTNELLRDTEYLATHANAYPNAQNPWTGYANNGQRTDIGIWMNNIKGLEIDSCSFNNEQTGIQSFDSRYIVRSCLFANSNTGIAIENTISSAVNNHAIFNNEFLNMTNSGIYIAAGVQDEIYNNIFGSPYGAYPSMTYGINLFATSNYRIYENEINKCVTGISAFGNQSGYIGASTPNWAGNRFNACETGIVTAGNNYNLTLRCNQHTPNLLYPYDDNWKNIVVIGSAPPLFYILLPQLANQGLSPYQCNDTRCPAGNRFWNPNYKDIASDGDHYYYYHHNHIAHPELVPVDTTSTIHITENNNEYWVNQTVSCLPVLVPIPNPTGVLMPPLLFSVSPYNQLDSLEAEKTALIRKKDSIVANLDHNETQLLLDALASNMPRIWLTSMLLSHSPLSDTVLIAAIIREKQFPPMMFTLIMLKNLPVSSKVYPYYLLKYKTLPRYFKRILKYAEANPVEETPTKLDIMIAGTGQLKANLTDRLAGYLLDTLNNRPGDAIALLEHDGSVLSLKTLVATYIDKGDYSAAAGKLAMIPQTGEADRDFVELYGRLLALYEQGKTLYEMNPADFAFVETLARECPENKAVMNARAIVELLTGERIPACPEEEEKRVLQIQGKEHIINADYSDADDEILGDNYPDPANNQTTIPYYIPEGIRGTIIINNIQGYTIARFDDLTGQNELRLNTTGWTAGTYFYSLIIEDLVFGTKKMVIVK